MASLTLTQKPLQNRGGEGRVVELHRPEAVGRIEQVIRRLQSVVSARISANGGGEIEEVHVVIDARRNPKQVARDIESVLLSELGVRVDHRKISIAQLRSDEAPGLTTDFRLKFLHIDLSLDRASTRAKVSLGHNGDVYAGAASASGPETRQPQLIARATLAAIEEFLRTSSEKGAPAGFDLLDLVTQKAHDGQELVMVTVVLQGEQGKEQLLGSALVKDDLWKAAACATLDAMNRRLPSLL